MTMYRCSVTQWETVVICTGRVQEMLVAPTHGATTINLVVGNEWVGGFA